jgi:chromosome segregation ATPase
MADFKVIETQEELDKIMGERLGREREKFETKYNELKTDNENLTKQVESLKQDLAEGQSKSSQYEETIGGLETKVKQYEIAALKTKIALENNLSLSIAERLQGEDEESIRKDAQAFSEIIGNSGSVLPLRSTEPEPVDGVEQAYKDVVNQLNIND